MAYDSEHGKLWQGIKADLDKIRARASKFAAGAEWAFGRRTARVLGVVVLFVVAVALLFWLLDLYIDPAKPGGKKDLILALAQILAGTALLSGLYFTWRGLRITQKAQEDNQLTTQDQLRNAQEQLDLTRRSQAKNQENTLRQLKNAQEELRLTREGQITERFTRAIDQLGNEETEVRIGGIYALERIAKESEEHYWPIIEILASYLQTRAKRSLVRGEIAKFSGEDDDDDRRHQHPIPDVQAALYVLARRDHSLDPKEGSFINLSSTDLRNADLRRGNLSGARLRRVNLEGAFLREVVFEKAVLSGAHLENTKLERARFAQANLRKAKLTKADLEGADLSDAYLKEADLTNANLTGANLRGAHIKKSLDDKPKQMITNEQLEQRAKSLKGATMPDGQKYEDWRKDKEGSGKNVENE